MWITNIIHSSTAADSRYAGSPRKLANKVALITGGNSGIGFATARLFVTEGARVAITGRNPETLQVAAQALGQNALVLPAHATDIEATERVVGTLVKQWGKLGWSSGLARPFHSADSARPMKSRKPFYTWLRTTRSLLQALKLWLTEEQPLLRMEHLSSGAAERLRAKQIYLDNGEKILYKHKRVQERRMPNALRQCRKGKLSGYRTVL